jgi:hypothetical protein
MSGRDDDDASGTVSSDVDVDGVAASTHRQRAGEAAAGQRQPSVTGLATHSLRETYALFVVACFTLVGAAVLTLA